MIAAGLRLPVAVGGRGALCEERLTETWGLAASVPCDATRPGHDMTMVDNSLEVLHSRCLRSVSTRARLLPAATACRMLHAASGRLLHLQLIRAGPVADANRSAICARRHLGFFRSLLQEQLGQVPVFCVEPAANERKRTSQAPLSASLPLHGSPHHTRPRSQHHARPCQKASRSPQSATCHSRLQERQQGVGGGVGGRGLIGSCRWSIAALQAVRIMACFITSYSCFALDRSHSTSSPCAHRRCMHVCMHVERGMWAWAWVC